MPLVEQSGAFFGDLLTQGVLKAIFALVFSVFRRKWPEAGTRWEQSGNVQKQAGGGPRGNGV